MSSDSSNCTCTSTNGGGVLGTPYLGGHLLQIDDFFQYASILHPLAIGSLAMIALFVALRFSMNVALGSTLAGIVNGNSLTRGLIGLIVLLGWQYFTSFSSCRFGPTVRRALNAPPLVVVFRGRKLDKVMVRHRINMIDLAGALRAAGVWNISEVEACILEPTGIFTIYKSANMPKHEKPEVLLAVPGYRALVDRLEDGHNVQNEKHVNTTPKWKVASQVLQATIPGKQVWQNGNGQEREEKNEKPTHDEKKASKKERNRRQKEQDDVGDNCPDDMNDIAQQES